MLVDGLNIGVCGLELGWLLLWNNHVDDTNRATGTSCFLESEFFELVHGLHRSLASRNLVTTPNDVSNLRLAYVVVEEPNAIGPNLVEANTTWSRFDNRAFLVTKDRIFAMIWIT